ncbi:MAG: molybdopterin molybdotransferase MoeA [Pirellulaceae bacterium]|jgi:molybdopterin molybdotransferase|nr:molybdopterin molybdotransferase MoeA [Pirellulaceae bacterium]
MIEIDEARARVLACVGNASAVTLPVTEAVGLVLAAEAVSDVDVPPHDKALVDGFAVQAADVRSGRMPLQVIEQVVAGVVPTHMVVPGTATQIMTGAPLPQGADAVVKVEWTHVDPGASPPRVQVEDAGVQPGQHILRHGQLLRRGDRLLPAGHRIRAVDVGLLCETGCWHVSVWRRPRVAVLATGNELVPAEQTPGVGQIRNSNGPLLSALAREAGCEVVDHGIARDDPVALRSSIERGLGEDVLLLSGGVSAGVLDLVPDALAALGVERVFHHVRLKPGKPLWFGTRSREGGRTLVFALPGNPVGSLVCFELFVRPVLRALLGWSPAVLAPVSVWLATPYWQRSDRPTLVPARVARTASAPATVTPLPWAGSSDQRPLGEANCLACFPAGDCPYQAGQRVMIYPLDADTHDPSYGQPESPA